MIGQRKHEQPSDKQEFALKAVSLRVATPKDPQRDAYALKVLDIAGNEQSKPAIFKRDQQISASTNGVFHRCAGFFERVALDY
jgi:hypothetical protein